MTEITDPSGITKFEAGTGAGLKMWGKVRANSGCNNILEHPESEIADGLTSMARCGAWASGLCWCEGEIVGEGVGMKGLGREIGPIRVERVASVHAGLSGSERGERAVLPMSLCIGSTGHAESDNVLCGEGGGAGSDLLD